MLLDSQYCFQPCEVSLQNEYSSLHPQWILLNPSLHCFSDGKDKWPPLCKNTRARHMGRDFLNTCQLWCKNLHRLIPRPSASPFATQSHGSFLSHWQDSPSFNSDNLWKKEKNSLKDPCSMLSALSSVFPPGASQNKWDLRGPESRRHLFAVGLYS